MDYFIKYIDGQPSFEELLVCKLHPCLETEINQRVFAQGQLGVNDEYLFGRILSFEPCIPKNTVLKIRLEAENNCFLELSSSGEGDATLKDAVGESKGKMTCYLLQGEDLQGEFWSANFVLELKAAQESLKIKLEKGTGLKGNFFRIGCDKSSAFENMGDFLIK